ncbi:MAG: uroporphyrinogen decarboxylase family protein [Armatimonadota bacterium]|nr:hypothetical protein [bacterium]
MKQELTSRERMLVAMAHGEPDTVPVSPDISNMIPCRLTGKPFWKIYRDQDPPLWKAYADAVRYFGFDGWQMHGSMDYMYADAEWSFSEDIVSSSEDRLVTRTTCHTPKGDLWMETTYYCDNPPTATRKWIKDLQEDMPRLRYMFPKIVGYNDTRFREQQAYSGDTAACTICVPVPGLQDLDSWFDGGVAAAAYAEADYPGEFAELVAWQSEYYLQMAEMNIAAQPDFFMMGASGLWTLQSPHHFRRYSLPVIQKMTVMAKQAGLSSFLHSCGKQRQLVSILAEETDLDVVNPLEIPQMGDCDLGEIKATFGDRLALMGNIHTTDVMLRGTPDTVREACEQAIQSAAPGGGFILSTGDQCGRDTPDENILAMVETARGYRY